MPQHTSPCLLQFGGGRAHLEGPAWQGFLFSPSQLAPETLACVAAMHPRVLRSYARGMTTTQGGACAGPTPRFPLLLASFPTTTAFDGLDSAKDVGAERPLDRGAWPPISGQQRPAWCC